MHQSSAGNVFHLPEDCATPLILLKGLAFAVAVGLAGSILPASRVARLPVIVALKSF